jgi:S1-C subfamily serine protease
MLFNKVNLFIKVFLTLVVIFSSNVAFSNFSDFEKAKDLIKSGEISEGIKSLKLSANHDPKSAHLLGLIYLNGKLLPLNKDIAFQYFLLGAEQCFFKSIQVVEKLFLFKRGSEYFNPQKIISIKKKCSNTSTVSSSQPEKPKNDREEIVEESRSLPQKPEKNNLQFRDNLITNDVMASWDAIFVDPNKINLISMGSGFAINKNGYFVTNEHVIEKCSSTVIIYKDMLGSGSIISKSKKFDLALIKVNAPTPYYVNLSSQSPKLGEEIVALGYPVGEIFGISPTVSFGMVKNTEQTKSAVRKEGFLLVDLEIASGNSGGPVFNKKGGLRGVVSYGVDAKDYQDSLNEQGINDFISSNTFSFIVSATTTKKWLKSIGIDFGVNSNQDYLNTETVTSLGLNSLAFIGCVE